MSISTWLEIWRGQASSKRLARLFGQPQLPEDRQLYTIWKQEYKEIPAISPFLGYVDQMDRLWEKVESAGVTRSQVSCWLVADDADEETHITLDPLTMLRLGEEGMKLCIAVNPAAPTHQPGHASQHQLQLVAIRDIVIEAGNLPGQAQITVDLDDGSVWGANFYTFESLQAHMFPFDPHDGGKPAGYLWKPYSLLVPTLDHVSVEKAVVGLLYDHQFERAFQRLDPFDENSSEQPNTQVSLRVVQPTNLRQPLDTLFLGQASEMTQVGHFFDLKHTPTAQEPLTSMLDMLDAHYGELAGMGVRRSDLTLTWSEVFNRQLNVEIQPESLLRLGKSGITLRVLARQVVKNQVRCLEL